MPITRAQEPDLSRELRMYRRHRQALMHRLPDGLVFVLGGQELVRNGDVHYPFRQKSHFLYLTGVEAPDYALLLNPQQGEELLLIPRITQAHRVWLGEIPSLKQSKQLYGVHRVAYLDQVPDLFKDKRDALRIYGDTESLNYLKTQIGDFEKNTQDFEESMSELRVLKSQEEIAYLLLANRMSAKGHLAAMAAARPGLYEYQVQAILEQAFRHAGLTHNSYNSIVATGKNSAVLHYQQNKARLKRGDLLLVDAGAEYKGYAADITRTFPVSGRFSPRQREVYEIVLNTQKLCIAQLRPGLAMIDLHLLSARLILEGLKHLRLIKGTIDTNLELGVDRVFYPHGLSHTLGLDVHDVVGDKRHRIKVPYRRALRNRPRIRFDRQLKAGNVITIEPGLYFIPALLQSPSIRTRFKDTVDFDRAERFLSLGGVRIEDDLLIGKTGCQNLTTVPREISDIEAACQK